MSEETSKRIDIDELQCSICGICASNCGDAKFCVYCRLCDDCVRDYSQPEECQHVFISMAWFSSFVARIAVKYINDGTYAKIMEEIHEYRSISKLLPKLEAIERSQAEAKNKTEDQPKTFSECYEQMKAIGPTGWDGLPSIAESLEEIQARQEIEKMLPSVEALERLRQANSEKCAELYPDEEERPW